MAAEGSRGSAGWRAVLFQVMIGCCGLKWAGRGRAKFRRCASESSSRRGVSLGWWAGLVLSDDDPPARAAPAGWPGGRTLRSWDCAGQSAVARLDQSREDFLSSLFIPSLH